MQQLFTAFASVIIRGDGKLTGERDGLAVKVPADLSLIPVGRSRAPTPTHCPLSFTWEYTCTRKSAVFVLS